MRAVQFARPLRLRWLAVSALAATGAIAWRAAHRTPAPPPPPLGTCSIPAIDPDPAPAPQHFAQPPPGDPRTQVVDAELVDRPSAVGGCGSFLIETTMTFRRPDAIGFADLRVLVPCAEMTRAQFGGPDAGTAGILRIGGRYLLTLRDATDAAPDGKNDTLYRAVRIDEGAAAAPVQHVTATLVSRIDPEAECSAGTFESLAEFEPMLTVGEGNLRVVVDCAQPLSIGGAYALDLVPDPAGGNAWRALSIRVTGR